MSHHTHAAILSTGDELVLGQLLDTNSRLLSQKLTDLGISVCEHVTVGDDLDTLVSALRRLADSAPLVIMSGGLGPTDGDLTRNALSRLSGQPLIEDPGAKAALVERFTKRGRAVTERQLRQAQRPASAICLPNDNGTAPGLMLTISGARGTDGNATTDIFALPGPPGELRPMLEAQVLPRLRSDPSRVILTRLLHVVGEAEADAVDRLKGLTDRSRVPLVGITASGAVLTIRIRYEGPGPRDSAERAMHETEQLVRACMGDNLFGAGDETLASAVVGATRRLHRTLATVESCTGGMLGAMLTEVPGVSSILKGGWVTYSNELKTKLVGVPEATLAAHGAVSEEVAKAMALGGLEHSGADLALSITGVAGPGGGSEAKPVGTVWIGLATRGPSGVTCEARPFFFPGSREDIRTRAARTALAMAYFSLVGKDPGKLLWQR